ncbi:hypothetical protein ACB092_08G095600 [Castanea dentata]
MLISKHPWRHYPQQDGGPLEVPGCCRISPKKDHLDIDLLLLVWVSVQTLKSYAMECVDLRPMTWWES